MGADRGGKTALFPPGAFSLLELLESAFLHTDFETQEVEPQRKKAFKSCDKLWVLGKMGG